MGKKETYFCDICKIESNTKFKSIDLQVIFLTEQTEGRSVNPYLSSQKIEMCKDCNDYVLKGNYLYGSGAMGYNEYYFKKKEK